MTHQSEIEKCHFRYCNTLVDDMIAGKIATRDFLHIYYYSVIPLSKNYGFPVPDRVKYAVDILEGYA